MSCDITRCPRPAAEYAALQVGHVRIEPLRQLHVPPASGADVSRNSSDRRAVRRREAARPGSQVTKMRSSQGIFSTKTPPGDLASSRPHRWPSRLFWAS
jgi:hypothetical protein